ncbi:RNA polymerase sigma-70 factor [Paraflavisolibacter sp. H34]|uniref:RNA polymerase sigma-70 factor n=1 Tax=Huijunlia imazamoxiresistens TaxID=3127457 RepID=UPI003017D3F9
MNTNDDGLLAEVKALFAAHDEAGIELLYEHYFDKLCAFAQSYLKAREPAEEVVEDVFVRLWSNKNNVLHLQNLPVYLYKAVKNGALNELEKRSRTLPADVLSDEYPLAAGGASPLEELILSEMMQSMQVAVDALPPRCRMIFKLLREDGLKYKEVAEILNISVNTIDSQMAIAIRRICAALGIRKGTEASPKKI